ncbi:S8 family peptidase [Nocardiopsis composta]|uniref:Subtilisin family serine protease n=1 Tax=Nocardiopsis composta TaxID=157465 RepID=A0A7W8VFD2_9ACTN|nr:S8 family serine peptidase [Nocardiopsis composta]MBB5433990.1 subtilisin family serine protease [Nocardiopsis composta]
MGAKTRRSAALATVLTLAGGAVLTAQTPALAAAGWELKAMAVDKAHATTEGEGMTVAVLDTGIATDHPDLNGRATEGRDMFGEDVSGEPWYGWHGTSMAGSVLKVAPEAQVVGYRVIRDEEDPNYSEEPEYTTQEDLGEGAELNPTAAGILEAVQDGADVVSMSVGDGGLVLQGYDAGVAWAVEQANAQGVVVVASAGNEGGEDEDGYQQDNEVSFPAAYPAVISVAASTPSGGRADFSQVHNYNDVAAPGVNIESAKNTGGRETVNGTSSAAALTAGVVALVKSANPDLAPRQVSQILESTASQSGAHDPKLGFGVIDAQAAVAEAGETAAEETLLAPTGYDGPAHFGPGDDGTPASSGVGLDSEYLVIGSVLGIPGLIAVLVGIGLLVSGTRAKRPAA